MKKIQKHLSELPPPHRAGGPPDNHPRLYHYTGFAGLLGIVKSKEFWLSDIHHLNDIAELKHALDELKSLLYPMILDKHPDKSLLNQILETAENFSEWGLFVGSFSEDHDLLSQWRTYSPDGGVSIGFVFNDIQHIAKARGFRLIKCIYSDGLKHELLRELISASIECLKSGDPIDKCLDVVALYYRMIAPVFKHHSFAEEREWRLIPDPTAYVRPNVDLNTNHEYDVRMAGTGLVPYYKLPLGALGMKKKKQYLGFDLLFIGPHYDADKLLSTINDLFSWENVYRPYVSHSDSPYRRSR